MYSMSQSLGNNETAQPTVDRLGCHLNPLPCERATKHSCDSPALPCRMFGDDPLNDEQNENENGELFDEPVAPETGLDDVHETPARLPWKDLDEEIQTELEEQSDTPMCDHDNEREVVPNQSGAGVSLAGTGVSGSETVNKVVCPVCGGE